MSLSKSEIRRALRQSCAAEFSAIAPEEEIDYTFSPAFCEEMDDLICEQKRGSWRLLSRTKRRVLVVAAIVALSLLLVAWTPPLRSAVAHLLTDRAPNRVDFAVSGQLRDDLETLYTLGYVPEGLSLESRESLHHYAFETVYRDEAGRMLIFMQCVADSASGTILNGTDNLYVKSVDGSTVLFCFCGTDCSAHWVYDGYLFKVYYRHHETPVDEAELVRIITSICPEE